MIVAGLLQREVPKTGRHSIDTGGTSPKSGAVTGQLGYWIDTLLGVFTYCIDTQFGLLD